VSGQFEIGGPTMVPVLQANESGLDLVLLAGGTVYPLPGDGLVAATGSGIEHARDLAGKRVGVPGIGTQLHVLLRRGLAEAGVNPDSVKFIEVGFLQASDALKSRLIDAYTSVEPFTQRIVKAGAGKLLEDWPEVPDGTTTIVFTSTRPWADQHRSSVAGFRAALREADEFIKSHRDETVKANAHYTKLPIEMIASMPISNSTADLSVKQVQFWIDLAKEQKIINGNPDPKRILFE
jgi:NitT/TauT family transport system substrate-binding protein